MRIALSTDDDHGLDAVLSYHFGRCPYYTFVDVEGKEIKNVTSVPNPFYANHGQPGQVPSFINSQGAQVIIAGGMGSRAVSFFQQFGIEPVTGVSGKVRDAVEAYVNGRLGGAEPCVESKSHGEPDWRTAPHSGGFEKDDVSRLEEEVTALRRQLAEAQERLNKLENKKE